MKTRKKNWEKLGIHIFSEPELNQPVLLAAWPGVGNIALRAVSYLKEKLGAELFGEIDPRPFFELPGVLIENNIIQTPRFPESKFYFWRRPQPGRDLIIFIGETQPPHSTYEFGNRVIDVAQYLGCDQIYTMAAALLAQLPENPRVWATASDAELVAELKAKGAVLQGDFFVAGMNGLLLAIARERGMQGICLLGETPKLIPQVDNPMASLAVLKLLVQSLNIEIDTKDMEVLAEQARGELSRLIMETQKKFIDDYTIPLWERDEESKS
ncbi:MAG: PAC2 family protein [Dehalococcoidia bacterium]|nr:PAC2 family protein [Dehalococcoidia bacterium]